MTMALILLAVTALALFFPFGRGAFKGLGLPAWGGFMVILAFVIGIVVPDIRLGDLGYLSVGGFILPILASIALAIRLGARGGLGIGLISMVAVVAITVGLLLIMPTSNMGLRFLTSVVIGIVTGVVSYIIARSRDATAFALLSGVPVGNLIFSILDYNFITKSQIVLGWSVVINALVLAFMIGVTIAELARSNGSVREDRETRRRRLSYEASRDRNFEEENYEDYNDDLF